MECLGQASSWCAWRDRAASGRRAQAREPDPDADTCLMTLTSLCLSLLICKMKPMLVHLTLEEHGFELHGPSYTQIFLDISCAVL